jgi:hypothetical protein
MRKCRHAALIHSFGPFPMLLAVVRRTGTYRIPEKKGAICFSTETFCLLSLFFRASQMPSPRGLR